MATDLSPASNRERAHALDELERRAEEIRDAVRVRVSASVRLRHAAESANETAEDVAQAVFLKLWGLVREGDSQAIRDLKAYAKTMADNYVASLARRPILRITDPAEPSTVERLAADVRPVDAPDQLVERRLSAAQVASIVGRLSERQRLMVKMRVDFGMTFPEIARVLGESPKRCEKQVERAFDRIRNELVKEIDLEANDRRRLSRVMAVKRWATPSLVAELRRDMRSDLRLASLWRQSNGAVHDVASAVAVDESLRRVGHGPGVADHLLGVIDRARDGLMNAVGRAGPEHEAAAGAAAGGTSLATKAIVAACIAGPAAAGGVCVGTGVVDLPGGADRTTPTPTVAETTATTTPTNTAESPTSLPVPTATTTPQPETPAERVNNELALGGSSSRPSSSSGTRDFAAPAGSSGSSGGGGGGSAGAGTFSFEK